MTKSKAGSKASSGESGQLVSTSDAIEILRAERLGSEDPISAEDQFINDVARWLQRWLDHSDSAQVKVSKASVFLFASDVDAEELLEGLELAPSFRMLSDQDLDGQVHACSLGLRKVARKTVTFNDASSALKWLTKSVGAEVTALIFVPKMRKAMVRRRSADANDCETLEFGVAAGTVFDFSQVDGLLDRFHEDWTKSHQGRCRVWAKAKERKLNTLAEQQIQGCLRGYFDLTVRPKGVLVEEEFFTHLGRGDVRLIRWKQSGSKPSDAEIEVCIMELKVLRPEKSANSNLQWALSGIQQALDYRAAENYGGPSYLCCFDGRKVDADMPAVEAQAKVVGVISKRYFMTTPGCP
jgi:hypothetical protein